MDRWIAYPMIVLQKKVDVLIDLRQAVDQCRYDRMRADQGVLEHEIDCGSTDLVTGVLQCVGYVEQKLRGLIVIGIDRKPRN